MSFNNGLTLGGQLCTFWAVACEAVRLVLR